MNDSIEVVIGQIIEDIAEYKPINDKSTYHESVNTIRIYVNPDYTLENVEDVLEAVVPNGYKYVILKAMSGYGLEVTVMIEEEDTVEDLVIEALGIDGGHHKQWYLNQIAEKLNLNHPNDRFGEGVPP